MTPIEQIKSRLDIVKVIGSYIEVKPAGKNFKANCPFHGEKTPSFMISTDRQTWHCFGACQEGGDIFKFVMKYENVEFYEALKVLAEKAGIELKKISPAEHKEFGVLYDINESAKNFFKTELEKSQIAKKYLSDRGLNKETLDEFEVGFAPNDFESLVVYLLNLGYDIKDIERAGVIFKSEKGKYLDRFRGRLMFPIFNHVGKIAGFSGRILPQLDNGEVGKYVNSPETPIFNKSKILYGFHKAKTEIHRNNAAILVEGQMDFLMCYQSGIKNIVASSGTAFTQEHLKAIKNQTDTIIFSFDNDEAGIRAAERSIDLANSMDFNTRILMLDGVKDPAEAVQKDPSIMKNAVERAVPAMEFYFKIYIDPAFAKATAGKENFADIKKSIRQLLEKIKKISSHIEQAHWILRLSAKTHINEDALRKEMDSLQMAREMEVASRENSPASVKSPKPTRQELIAERVLKIAVNFPKLHPLVQDYANYLPRNFKTAFDVLIDKKPLIIPSLKNAIDEFALKATMEDIEEEKASAEISQLLGHLKAEYLKDKRTQLIKLIKEAESMGDKEKLAELLREFDETSKIIQN